MNVLQKAMRHFLRWRTLVVLVGILYAVSVEAAPVVLCLCCPPPCLVQTVPVGADTSGECCSAEVEGLDGCHGDGQTCCMQDHCLEECTQQSLQGIAPAGSQMQLLRALRTGWVGSGVMWGPLLTCMEHRHGSNTRSRGVSVLTLPELCSFRC